MTARPTARRGGWSNAADSGGAEKGPRGPVPNRRAGLVRGVLPTPRAPDDAPDDAPRKAPAVVRLPPRAGELCARLSLEAGLSPAAVVAWALARAVSAGDTPRELAPARASAAPIERLEVVRLPARVGALVAELASRAPELGAPAVVAWALVRIVALGELPPPAASVRQRCADPTCRRWFTRPAEGPGSTQLYCGLVCGKRTREREAKRRMRAR